MNVVEKTNKLRGKGGGGARITRARCAMDERAPEGIYHGQTCLYLQFYTFLRTFVVVRRALTQVQTSEMSATRERERGERKEGAALSRLDHPSLFLRKMSDVSFCTTASSNGARLPCRVQTVSPSALSRQGADAASDTRVLLL